MPYRESLVDVWNETMPKAEASLEKEIKRPHLVRHSFRVEARSAIIIVASSKK